MTEWISVKDGLPDIDYANQKSACDVMIKINNNEAFVTKCKYREIWHPEKPRGYLFYDLDKGAEYHGVSHWMPLPTPREDK